MKSNSLKPCVFAGIWDRPFSRFSTQLTIRSNTIVIKKIPITSILMLHLTDYLETVPLITLFISCCDQHLLNGS